MCISICLQYVLVLHCNQLICPPFGSLFDCIVFVQTQHWPRIIKSLLIYTLLNVCYGNIIVITILLFVSSKNGSGAWCHHQDRELKESMNTFVYSLSHSITIFNRIVRNMKFHVCRVMYWWMVFIGCLWTFMFGCFCCPDLLTEAMKTSKFDQVRSVFDFHTGYVNCLLVWTVAQVVSWFWCFQSCVNIHVLIGLSVHGAAER